MLDIEAERWWWEDEFLPLFMFIWGTHVPFLGFISKGQKTQMTQRTKKKTLANLKGLCLMHLMLKGLDPPRNRCFLKNLSIRCHISVVNMAWNCHLGFKLLFETAPWLFPRCAKSTCNPKPKVLQGIFKACGTMRLP